MDTHAPLPTAPMHNSFARRWPCSNDVWSFCVATGERSRRTVLSPPSLQAQMHACTFSPLFCRRNSNELWSNPFKQLWISRVGVTGCGAFTFMLKVLLRCFKSDGQTLQTSCMLCLHSLKWIKPPKNQIDTNVTQWNWRCIRSELHTACKTTTKKDIYFFHGEEFKLYLQRCSCSYVRWLSLVLSRQVH